MARRQLVLKPERVDWLPDSPDEGRRPIRCVLVGGRAEYGNVRKLPDLLWDNFGIAVVEHVIGTARTPAGAQHFDFAVGLVDQTSHDLMAWARASSERIVYCPSTWSKIQLALQEAGITPLSGTLFHPPEDEDKGLDPPSIDGVVIPLPTQKKEALMAAQKTDEDAGLPTAVKGLLVKLKKAMADANLERLLLELHDSEMSVEYRRVVVRDGLEVL